MFHSLFLFRRLLAATFLVVFVNVFLGQCWCATLNPSPGIGQRAHGHKVAAKPAHASCHGYGNGATFSKAKASLPQKPAGKHDCCKDKSASLLSSLTMPTQKHVLALAPAVLPTTTDFFFRPATGSWDRTGTVVLIARQQLPPKIPDIRIYIQSLTV